ncbi:ribonuclease HI family protein [Patescibacteria group bacterium]
MKKITVFTDGGSRNNPGIAGAGACVVGEDGEVVKTAKKFLGIKTNNWAEYEAVVLGLETLKEMFGEEVKNMEVEVKLDSELVTKQIKGEYRVKEPTLILQFKKVKTILTESFNEVVFTHVRRAYNKCADKMANEAMDEGGDE